MKKISFVILTWNSQNFISDCLNSIYNLKAYKSYICIIDNGSIDETVSIVKGFEKLNNDNFILESILLKTNVGTTVSRNMGLNKIKDTDYICVLDSDTIINDDAFIYMANYLDTHENCAMVGPKMITSSGLVQTSARKFPILSEKFLKAIPLKSLQKIAENMETINNTNIDYQADYLMSACWLLKPHVLNTVGLFDENIFYAPEDAEYCIRVWKAGYKIAYCGNAQIIHEWQRLSQKKYVSKMNYIHIKGLIYMFNKHNYWFNLNKLRKTFTK